MGDHMAGMFENLAAHALTALWEAFKALAVPLPFFFLLAIATKGRRLIGDMKRAAAESRLNILMHFTDALIAMPMLVVLAVGMKDFSATYDLSILPAKFWDGRPLVAVGFAAVFLGDFIGYWRHRMEHLPIFWPSHAIHHSDTEMTWLAIFRFHPINRLTTTVVDYAFLLAMGLPAYALVVSMTVRHFYGAFIHADLPWTYGPLRNIFVSPAMHRWHHANDKLAYNTNYATVFSLFDVLFGTFRVPGRCAVPLGVPEQIGAGLIGAYAYPFKVSSYRYFLRRLRHWRGQKTAAKSAPVLRKGAFPN